MTAITIDIHVTDITLLSKQVTTVRVAESDINYECNRNQNPENGNNFFELLLTHK
jgi:hypothetical protein